MLFFPRCVFPDALFFFSDYLWFCGEVFLRSIESFESNRFSTSAESWGVVAPPEMLEAAKFLNSIQDRMAVWKHMCERARAKAGREEWMSFEMCKSLGMNI